MDDFNKTCNRFIAAGAAMLVISTGLALYYAIETTNKYKEVCVSANGTPIYNGKHWECLK